MPIDCELLKWALDALEGVCGFDTALRHEQVIAAIRARLEQKDDEPVAWLVTYKNVLGNEFTVTHIKRPDPHNSILRASPLYLHPPAKQKPSNFCSRCGKRISTDEYSAHTCTPPSE